MMSKEKIAQLAFLLYPHLTQGELDPASVEALDDKIRQLQKGLLPEDEFATTVGRILPNTWTPRDRGFQRWQPRSAEVGIFPVSAHEFINPSGSRGCGRPRKVLSHEVSPDRLTFD